MERQEYAGTGDSPRKPLYDAFEVAAFGEAYEEDSEAVALSSERVELDSDEPVTLLIQAESSLDVVPYPDEENAGRLHLPSSKSRIPVGTAVCQTYEGEMFSVGFAGSKTGGRELGALWGEHGDQPALTFSGGLLRGARFSAINRRAELIGWMSSGFGSNHGFVVDLNQHGLFGRSRVAYLERKGMRDTWPLAIAESGEIVGVGRDENKMFHPLYWLKRRLRRLPLSRGLEEIGGVHGAAFAASDFGSVVGSAFVPVEAGLGESSAESRYREQAMLWVASKFGTSTATILGTLDGTESRALGVNKWRWVVGLTTYGDTSLEAAELVHAVTSPRAALGRSRFIRGEIATRAFIWTEKIGICDLNDLVGDPGWWLETANAIDDSGRIVGCGWHNGRRRAYLLVPVGEFGELFTELASGGRTV